MNLFPDNSSFNIATEVYIESGEVFRTSTGEYSDYSESLHLSLIDFNLYDAFLSYVDSQYKKDDGSYMLKGNMEGVTLGSTFTLVNFIESLIEVEDAFRIQRNFIAFLEEQKYIKPLKTKNVFLGDFPYFEIRV